METKNHKNFNQKDYDYLTSKGYTDEEILAIWDRDEAQGKNACTHNIDFSKPYKSI